MVKPPTSPSHSGAHWNSQLRAAHVKERLLPRKSKMPGLVKVAEKREHARIARVKASVSPELARDVGLTLSRGWSPFECALYLAQMMPPQDRAVLYDLLMQLRRPGRPPGS